MLGTTTRAIALLALCACRLNFDDAPNTGDAGDGGPGDSLGTDGAGASAVFEVGTFTKLSTPGMQVVPHTLGVTPRALILWSSGNPSVGVRPHARFAIGFTDQTRTSRAIAIYSQDNISRVSDRRISTSAFTHVGDAATTTADAAVTSWGASSLTFDWTINDGASSLVHYLLIGGSGVQSSVVDWAMPAVQGPIAVTGIPFRPDVVLHGHVGAGVTLAPPANQNQAGLGLGAMTTNAQWALAIFIADGTGNSNTQRGARTDACVFAFDANEVENRRAAFSSMDAQGFTLDFGVVGAAGTPAVSLALAGVDVQVGTFQKPASPATSVQVQGMAFSPSAVLLATQQDVTRGVAVVHSRFAFGGSTSTAAASVAFSDTDNLAISSVDSFASDTDALMKVDNDNQLIDAELARPSFEATGFTSMLPINDATPSDVHYVAFGAK